MDFYLWKLLQLDYVFVIVKFFLIDKLIGLSMIKDDSNLV